MGKSNKETETNTPSPIQTKSTEELRAQEMHDLAISFHDLFKASARRWEMIIYPAIIAIFIMSGVFFGVFFVIVNNIQAVVEDSKIGSQMSQVSQNMAGLSDNIRVITLEMAKMGKSMTSIDGKMADIKYMRIMSQDIAQMNSNMHYMNQNMGQMRTDFSEMNHNVSKPMSMINSFMPW